MGLTAQLSIDHNKCNTVSGLPSMGKTFLGTPFKVVSRQSMLMFANNSKEIVMSSIPGRKSVTILKVKN